MNTLPTLNYEAFRQRLFGLTVEGDVSKDWPVEYKSLLSGLCVGLARVYSEDLDRMKLWDRIDSALTTSAAKSSGDDLERFVNECCEHVKAAPGAVANCGEIQETLFVVSEKPAEWRAGLLSYLTSHRYVTLVLARQAWESAKDAGRKAGAA